MSTHRLAPGLLLAAPQLGDPNFERSVVLLARHSDEGALGWVINGRPLSTVREILVSAGVATRDRPAPTSPAFDRVARVGGPVSPSSGWIVYRPGKIVLPGEILVGDQIAVSGDAAALDKLMGNEGPEDFRLLIGYAGWGAGQLENEVSAGAWLPADADGDLVFDSPWDAVWDAAYHRTLGAAPATFVATRGGSA